MVIDSRVQDILSANNWFDIPRDYTGVACLSDGGLIRFRNGVIHNEVGPAVVQDGFGYWYLNDREVSLESGIGFCFDDSIVG